MILHLNLNENSYDIVIERNCLNDVKNYFDLNRKVLIVTDDGVPNKYSQTILDNCDNGYILTLKQGEENKNMDSLKVILEKLCELNFNRHDCVIACGGGVIGDMAGFAASIYMRGIDFYNVPTTSLSQIDSSIGGKTAIDFGGYKNIVGSFYQPKKVLIDPETLNTLSKRQLNNGLVEALKMSVTHNEELFNIFKNNEYLNKIDEVIVESLKIKKQVVEEDEKELGLRKVLNFGHTIAHGIELNSNLYHGESVALGMLCMSSNSIKNELTKIYNHMNISSRVDVDIEKTIESITHDKKSNGNTISCVVVDEIGKFNFVNKNKEELTKLLKEIVR